MNITENKREWDGRHHWADGGDEWSAPWGGPARQWHGSILPRLAGFLPADRILEIACGHGRITQYLKDACRSLMAVDLSERCVTACQKRFADCPRMEFHLNDGKSLAVVADQSVDLAFSFDSLVHADAQVLEAYIQQLPRILKSEGVAFLHHSNLGEYQKMYQRIRRIPGLEGWLQRVGLLDESIHWRDWTVTAGKVERWARENGLCCIRQEIVRWRTRRVFNDCFSVLVPAESARAQPHQVARNPRFMMEADNLSWLARFYDGPSAGASSSCRG
mgnify:CR=1 FL=1